MPDIKEKLVELIGDLYGVDPMYFGVDAPAIAAHLIANGVTIKTEPQTNADRLRAMSDEELAKWILDGVSSDPCDYCGHTNEEFCDGSPCIGAQDKDVIIAWLQQPAEEVNKDA